MKNTQQFPDGFESWISNKSWKELNTEELKQLQEEGISEDEFFQLKQMLIQLEKIEEEPLKPRDELKNSLMEAFDKGPGKPGKVIAMPVWIATFAVAAAVLVFFVWFMPKEASKNTVADIPQINQKENNQGINSETTNPVLDINQKRVNQEQTKALTDNLLSETPAEESSTIKYETGEFKENLNSESISEDAGKSQEATIIDDASVSEKIITTSTSMAQNFSPTFNHISAKDFSAGSAAQNFDQPKSVAPNQSLSLNKSMLDILVTVY